jgi:hypothetical protein
MQKFDQQVAPSGRVGEQSPHFGKRIRINLTPLGDCARCALPIKLRDVDHGTGRH